MTRLTNDIRDSIARRATDTAFKKEHEALVKEEHNLGIELYQHVFDKATLAAVKKIDKKWFSQDACLRFNDDMNNNYAHAPIPQQIRDFYTGKHKAFSDQLKALFPDGELPVLKHQKGRIQDRLNQIYRGPTCD